MNNTINGTYGSGGTPCTVFTHTDSQGLIWYCVEDSANVNATYETLENGVDVELVEDADGFCWSSGILSEDELENAVNE